MEMKGKSRAASGSAQNGGMVGNVADGLVETDGRPRNEVIHRMGRRCINWDYHTRCIYQITITLANRRQHLLGELAPVLEAEVRARHGMVTKGDWEKLLADLRPAACGDVLRPAACGRVLSRGIELTAFGCIVAECWAEIPLQWPGVDVLDLQIMPEHIHGVIFVREWQAKPLGSIIGSFKAKCTSRYRAASGSAQSDGSAQSVWAKGYVDRILWREGQLKAMLAYQHDNPRRLAIKRAAPLFFRQAFELRLDLGPVLGHGSFATFGNRFLLDLPLAQVQCSRAWFAYHRIPKPGGGTKIARDATGEPIVARSTPEYEDRREALLALARHGTVLISPCVSDGERQIAREAMKAELPLVTMQNMGFAALFKPSGRYFDACVEGRLLMLAPAAWPYQPGEKSMTRFDAVAMNRLCQAIAGEGAANVNYHGMRPSNIDDLARSAVMAVERNRS